MNGTGPQRCFISASMFDSLSEGKWKSLKIYERRGKEGKIARAFSSTNGA